MLFHSKCYNQKDWKKEDYVDIWEILDKDVITREFDCIDFYDVPEFQGKFEQMETERSYTGNLGGVIDGSDISCYYSHKMKTIDPDQIVFTGDDNVDKFDFDHFCQGRKSINLNDYTKKFLHFENNLFGHFFLISPHINKRCRRHHEKLS